MSSTRVSESTLAKPRRSRATSLNCYRSSRLTLRRSVHPPLSYIQNVSCCQSNPRNNHPPLRRSHLVRTLPPACRTSCNARRRHPRRAAHENKA
ncbi:unnamed protein product [Tuber aestivum]|uniref:Uncharacterized protein n=1 Tax=Tuber aestivum TaxID=59557 RepID=A0A292PNJ9_9PEZI|nr:unnamed protein product [Tuber aestivum]